MTRSSAYDPNVTFLVGAGRSGTTLLYKVLCLHPDIAYISNYHNRMPWLRADLLSRVLLRDPTACLSAWFRDSGNAYFVDRPWTKKFFPTPVEGEALLGKCGLPLFPSRDEILSNKTIANLRRAFSLIQHGAHAKTVVCKRTANNRRVPQLNNAFPAARYIQLIRDGRDVAHSLSQVDWWENHTVWWDGRTAAEMEAAGEERLRICARNWVKEIEELDSALERIAKDKQLEIRYESFLASPVEELEKIIDFLGLSFTSEYRDSLISLNLRPRPNAWSKRWSKNELSSVLSEAGPLLNRLGYQ